MNNFYALKIGLLLFLSFCCLSNNQAQDIHHAQFYNTPLHTNPALAGIFDGYMRFTGNYRNQWSSVPVPFTTFAASFDMRVPVLPNYKKGFFSGGALFNYDKAGDAQLSLTQVNLVGSYTHILNEMNLASIAVMLGGGQRAFDPVGLQYDNQYNGDLFDPTRGSGENFTRTSVSFADISVGFNWHLQRDDNRSSVDAGVAVYHVNRPNQSFTSQAAAQLNQRITFGSFGEIEVQEKIDWLLYAIAHFQGSYLQGYLGSGVRYYLSNELTKKIAVQFTTSYRTGDAIIPAVGMFYNNWQFGLSYDINISDFDVATNGQGGPELSVVYIIKRVAPVKTFEACPIF